MQLEELLDLLEGVRPHNGFYMARCPAHEDNRASLQVSERPDSSLGLFCHRGCSFVEIVNSLGRKVSDFQGVQEPVVYIYEDEHRRPSYEKIRNPGKEFVFRRYVGDTVEWGLGDTRRILYRLPEIQEADPERWVFITEGEKDADAIWEAGGVATTYGGVNDWQTHFADYLEGRNVTIIQDKDDAGRKVASQILLDLSKKAARTRLVEARQGKDASDHLAAGYGLDEFVEPSHFTPYDFTKPTPPVAWLWENYLAEGDLVLLAGKPKLGKSWLTMGLAVAVSNGQGYFLGLKASEGRVLYFDEENPEDVAHSRMVQSLGHRRPDKLRYILHGGLRLDTHPELLMQEALLYQPKLIIIDSLAAVQMKEENSRAEMGEILRGVLKPLAVETGAAVLLIHHHDKQGNGPRGSGDIEAAVDSIINLKGTPGTGVFVMETSSRRRRSADEKVLVKVKDMPGIGTRLEASPIT